MEKRKPHHDLDAFKARFDTPDRLVMTTSAIAGATELGLDDQGVVDVIQSMTLRHFYKSMTSYADHRSWQDVYHVPWSGKVLYLKFTADRLTLFRVLSLKER